MSDVDLLRPNELGSPEIDAWNAAIRADPDLNRPFLSIEWLQLVGRHRDSTRVLVARDETDRHAFLAMDVIGRVAGPLGVTLSDHQGIVTARGRGIDVAHAIRRCGLDVLKLDHIIDSQRWLAGKGPVRERSAPFIDLRAGWEHHLAHLRAGGSSLGSWLRRKRNIAERRFGELRVEEARPDGCELNRFIAFKSAQYRRTGAPDIFAARWVSDLLAELSQTNRPSFSGQLTVLYAGETAIAHHLGVNGRTWGHWWLPTYNPDAAVCSPGILLLAATASDLAERGVSRLDLGPGDEPYKRRITRDQSTVLATTIEAPGPRMVLRQARQSGRRLASRVRHWMRVSRHDQTANDPCGCAG